TVPSVVISPIELFAELVNQRLPSIPAAMLDGCAMLGSVKLLTIPVGVIWPMEPFPELVNQRFPSGPTVIPDGAEMVASVKSVTAAADGPAISTAATPAIGTINSIAS